MESTTVQVIDLFAGEVPEIGQLARLAKTVNSSEKSILDFSAKVEENLSKTGAEGCLACGIGLCMLGRYAQAIDKFEKAKDCPQKYLYLAYALRARGRFDEAIKSLQKAAEHNADALMVNLEKAATYRIAKNFDAAEKQLKACAGCEQTSAEYHYQLGRLQDALGQYEQAMQSFARAIEIDPMHKEAIFHLAYRCDLCGDEEAAIDYYRQVMAIQPIHINALLNLAVLYEDCSEHDKAMKCVAKVLKYHPNHHRARLFQKDIESSQTMFYDEEKEKKRTRRNQILETPISDFELSVRSRNCLKKMNIHTIGDLLRITEAELLSYKNFGETSLREIKAILDSKNLRLGMNTEEGQQIEQPEQPVEQNDGMLNRSIDELQLSVRARKCLIKLNIRTFGDLVRKTEAELLGCKNFGVTSLNEIKKAIESFGLSLRSLE